LALDPETRINPPGDEDIEMLMRSLAISVDDPGHGDMRSSVVRPGYSVQFLVSPLDPRHRHDNGCTPSAVFGVSQAPEDGLEGAESVATTKYIPGSIQVLSRRIFVKSGPTGQTYFKINVPCAALMV